MRKNFFLELDELLGLYKRGDWQVIIWGTGVPAQDVYFTLMDAGIEIYAWGDNCADRQGELLNGKLIIGREKLKKLKNPMILIACWMSFGSILRSLENEGYRNVYGFMDSIKYDIDEMRKDVIFLSQTNKLEKGAQKEKILLEIYGNIGDILIHIGILNYFLSKYGDSAYVLVEGESLLELIGLMTPRVLAVNRMMFHTNRNYRRRLLTRLQSLGFRKSILLSDARIISTRRVLNQRIFPVDELVYSKDLALGEYLPHMDASGLWSEKIPASAISPCRILDNKVDRLDFTHHLPEHYVSVNMGTSSDVRKFSSEKICEVVNYILSKGFSVVFIGAGSYDEQLFEEIKQKLPVGSSVYSFISHLSILESLYVIRQSLFFVGTESGMWNASYVLGIPSVVIYGRGDYGSFFHKSESIIYIMSDDYGCMGCCWFCTNRDNFGRPRCISEICSGMITEGIETLLLKQDLLHGTMLNDENTRFRRF